MVRFFEKIYKGKKDAFFSRIREDLAKEERAFIVTANPEAFICGKREADFAELLLHPATTVIADGVGIVKGGKKLGFPIEERIPGVELAEKLFAFGNELGKSIFLLGARQKVLDDLCRVLREKYPRLIIAGALDGYRADMDEAFCQIKEKKPDIVLVALGIPKQERLIFKHLFDFEKGVFVGVGGSFDVLSGNKDRAPQFWIRHNLEWLYRIMKEPRRVKRFYQNNVKFFFQLKK